MIIRITGGPREYKPADSEETRELFAINVVFLNDDGSRIAKVAAASIRPLIPAFAPEVQAMLRERLAAADGKHAAWLAARGRKAGTRKASEEETLA